MSMVRIERKGTLPRLFRGWFQVTSGLQDELTGSQEFLPLKRSDEIGLAEIAISIFERVMQASAEILLVTVGYLDFIGSEIPGVVVGQCVPWGMRQGGC